MSKVSKTPKGTKDFGPSDVLLREHIFKVLKSKFQKYDGKPIQTPVLELQEKVTSLLRSLKFNSLRVSSSYIPRSLKINTFNDFGFLNNALTASTSI